MLHHAKPKLEKYSKTQQQSAHLDEEGLLQPVALTAAGADHHAMHQQVLCKVWVRGQHNLHSTAQHSTT
jgi:hypothetical protein